jgi:hypothetical protein
MAFGLSEVSNDRSKSDKPPIPLENSADSHHNSRVYRAINTVTWQIQQPYGIRDQTQFSHIIRTGR